MGKGYLVDTNVLIDAQMNRLPPGGLDFLAEIIDSDFTVSFITYIEFRGYKEISSQSEEFISMSNVIGIDKDIIDRCISIRKSKSIKLPDAIIAATALSRELNLVTHNTADFRNISGLIVTDPWDI